VCRSFHLDAQPQPGPWMPRSVLECAQSPAALQSNATRLAERLRAAEGANKIKAADCAHSKTLRDILRVFVHATENRGMPN
jgi:hypothetical protein